MANTYKVRHTAGWPDTLVANCNGCIERINIDRTHYATEWNRKHGMVPVETVETDSGERFIIWRGKDLACAVPVWEVVM